MNVLAAGRVAGYPEKGIVSLRHNRVFRLDFVPRKTYLSPTLFWGGGGDRSFGSDAGGRFFGISTTMQAAAESNAVLEALGKNRFTF